MHVAMPKARWAEKALPGERPLGFLAAGRDPALGYLGGYLLATARGRPLEFHYTTPIQPSPTHRILYGAELEPYIYDELIAATLLQQSGMEPAFIVTDQPLVLRQRARSSCPIICAGAASGAGGSASEFTTHTDFAADRAAVEQGIAAANPSLDVREPFGRIWEAVREALRAGQADGRS